MSDPFSKLGVPLPTVQDRMLKLGFIKPGQAVSSTVLHAMLDEIEQHRNARNAEFAQVFGNGTV